MRRRTSEGMSKAEVIRCLKRYVAREAFSTLRNADHIALSTPLTSSCSVQVRGRPWLSPRKEEGINGLRNPQYYVKVTFYKVA